MALVYRKPGCFTQQMACGINRWRISRQLWAVLTVCLSSRKQWKETEWAEMLMRLFTENQATFSGWLRKVQTHQVPQVRQEGEPLRRACLQGGAHCPFHTAAPLASTQKPQSLLPRLKSIQALLLKKQLHTTNASLHMCVSVWRKLLNGSLCPFPSFLLPIQRRFCYSDLSSALPPSPSSSGVIFLLL